MEMMLTQNCQWVVEPVETTSDYQPDTHFDRYYNEFIELLIVQIKTGFLYSLAVTTAS